MSHYAAVIQKLIPDVEYHQNRYARELDAVVSSGCRWLDIGAGTRVHTGWIGCSDDELISRAAFVCGCDLEIQHLSINTSLSAVVGADAVQLPFADDSFDVVSANMVLEHLPVPHDVFREISRVLTPGGRFVFVTPHRGHPAVRFSSIALAPRIRRRLAVKLEQRVADHVFLTHYAANTPRRVAEISAAVGLHVDQLDVFPSYPFFRRPIAAVVLESLWIRSLSWAPLRLRFGSNLVGRLSKPAESRAG